MNLPSIQPSSVCWFPEWYLNDCVGMRMGGDLCGGSKEREKRTFFVLMVVGPLVVAVCWCFGRLCGWKEREKEGEEEDPETNKGS